MKHSRFLPLLALLVAGLNACDDGGNADPHPDRRETQAGAGEVTPRERQPEDEDGEQAAPPEALEAPQPQKDHELEELPRPTPKRPATPQPPLIEDFQNSVAEHLNELKARTGSAQDPDKLFQRNVGVYFATWLFPESRREAALFSRAFREAAVDFADRLLRALREEVPAGRSITPKDVRAVRQQLIPVRIDEYGDLHYFPNLPEPERIRISGWDFEYLRLTGRSWVVLERALASADRAREIQNPFEPAAIEEVGTTLSYYLLALLRCSGLVAKDRQAPALRDSHLRRAEVILFHKRQSHPAEPVEGSPAPPQDSWFVRVTRSTHIDFRHENTEWVERFRRQGHLLPTDADGGVTSADLDQDGWPDLLFCGADGAAAYRNRGDGTFENVTGQCGIAVPGEARMAIVADFDNDGARDLFVSYAKDTNRIFRNRGVLEFEDVTTSSGLENDGFLSGPSCAFDYDRDGLLDLYVGNFGNYLDGDSPYLTKDNKNGQPNQLFHNLGGFRFEEVTAQAGVGDPGWCQAVSHCDFDGDGWQDLYVTNDFGRNDLLLNRGDGTFASAGGVMHADDPWHGMNVSFGDLNRDWIPDIFITNIWEMNNVRRLPQEWNVLLLSQANAEALPTYRSMPVDRDRMSDTGWSWGALFFDADNDADDDLYCVNGLTGYPYHYAEREHPDQRNQYYPYFYHQEANHFYRNDGGNLVDATEGSGLALHEVNSRGLATIDYDLDGDLDLAVSTYQAPPVIFRNDKAEGNWLRLRLIGDPAQNSNRDAIGATIRATTADGTRLWRCVTGGEGFLSMSSPAVELGLGSADSVDLEILWPGGQSQAVHDVAANQQLTIEQE